MLFNSGEFILLFLPIVFIGFLIIAEFRRARIAAAWLTLASLVFYSWWRWENLPLLLASMAFNYWLGGKLMRRPAKQTLAIGIAVNVGLLAYFKYTMFVLATSKDLFGGDWQIPHVILPLAISFFTFQQIAYLVDAHGGRVSERDPLNYALFITFFPHLIAGPITHHREMLTQFSEPGRFRPRWDMVAVGLTLFLVGLFKKVMIADPFGVAVRPIFDHAEAGGRAIRASLDRRALPTRCRSISTFPATPTWRSGWACCSASRLPPNFNSPYKARNIIDYLVALAHDADAVSDGLYLQPDRRRAHPAACRAAAAVAAPRPDERGHLRGAGRAADRSDDVASRASGTAPAGSSSSSARCTAFT